MLLLFLATILAIGFLAFIITKPKKNIPHATNSAPSPPGLPLLQHTHLVLLDDIDKVAHRLNSTYGDVVEIFLAGTITTFELQSHV